MSAICVFNSAFAEVTRQGRHIIASLKVPAKVLATCTVNGGLRTDLTHLVNHQSCEPVKHQERFEVITGLGPVGYHAAVCAELGLAKERTALMGTAAAMQYLGIVTETFADLSVTAIVTAGVTGNAGCAGDPSHYDEKDGVWSKCSGQGETAKAPGTHGGTINTLVFLSCPLSDGALARAAITMAEGKSAALTELAIGSKYSWRPATGTGTDQFAIAAPLAGVGLRTWTGKHTKAGELIGLCVRRATLEALRWQNGLEPSYTRSIIHALGRFGCSEERLKSAMEKRLSPSVYQLFKDNWNPVIHDPQLSAAAYAFAAVLDRALCGTIGPVSAPESLVNQGALMAAGLAARPEDFAQFRQTLARHAHPDTQARTDLPASALDIVFDAIALGWVGKWERKPSVQGTGVKAQD